MTTSTRTPKQPPATTTKRNTSSASTADRIDQGSDEEKQEPLHKPFSWLADGVKNDRRAQFAAMTLDICQGVETCLELVHTSSLERHQESPMMGAGDTDRLLRMAMASIRLLGESAEADIEFLNDSQWRAA